MAPSASLARTVPQQVWALEMQGFPMVFKGVQGAAHNGLNGGGTTSDQCQLEKGLQKVVVLGGRTSGPPTAIQWVPEK